jgi:undecaprenyl pyrophosphate synthase
MDKNLENKLSHLGISVWKNRFQQVNTDSELDMYLIDDCYLFIFGAADQERTQDEKEFFLNTLVKSLYKETKFRKIDLNEIYDIFIFNSEVPEFLADFNKDSIFAQLSMESICSSRETKTDFLNTVKEIIN